ncbi:barstar family protein [Sedimentibacter sp.]|uniref:barstar family protein n=1 Tax=Sedimentibacter sp. TaxID=1960295 RepID=UPI0028ABE624|nr:barstar family protein [Sedimentibacter sp.]
MKYITLDFSGIKTMYDLHTYLKKAFHLPDYYGYNLDALWDCLHCSFAEPTIIVLRHMSVLPEEINEAVEVMNELFNDLEKQDDEVTIHFEDGDKKSNNEEFMI